MQAPAAAQAIYDNAYADTYDALYLHPWPNKHRHNLATLARILESLPSEGCRWLDLCCGQAWHFAQFPASIVKVGLDISPAQLRRARQRNPDASFIQGDVLQPNILRPDFTGSAFDLVTSFWGAYCYLDDPVMIGTFVDKAISWTRRGGSVYLEILLAEMLESFNRSAFAGESGFRVTARSSDFSRWSYRDCGGEHLMTSPPLAFFTSRVEPFFESVNVNFDNGFMYHLVASRRTTRPGPSRSVKPVE